MIGEKESSIISVLRLPLMIMVVCLHMPGIGIGFQNPSYICRIWFLLCSCAMPLFMMISGYLLFIKHPLWTLQVYRKVLTSRFFSLLCPYLVFITSQLILTAILQWLLGITNRNEPWIIASWGVKDYLTAYGVTNEYTINFSLWFLRDLMLFILISPAFAYLLKHWKTASLVLILMGLFFPRNFTGASNFYCATSYFAFGGYVAYYLQDFSTYTQKENWLLPVFCILIPTCLFIHKELIQLALLIGILLIIYIAGHLEHLLSFLKTPKIAQFSMFLYGFHLPYIRYIARFLKSTGVTNPIFFNILCPIVTVLLWALLFVFLSRLNNKCLAICLWGGYRGNSHVQLINARERNKDN